ncbi:transposase [Candidatus Daviesbacteria bacterium]|nr:transposase [Candidatus Daviesbacteria bacterium]
MAFRKTLIVTNEIYHVFNRSVGQQPIFLSSKDYERAVEVLRFYQYGKLPLRFSFFNRLAKDQKETFLLDIEESLKPVVKIICFCLMPNHIHFLLKNLTENGITQFMGNLQNSYARYFNIKNGRTGTLFQQNFKAVRIETDEQLVHVSRYIHLNPVTAYLIKPEELKQYEWSSYKDYLNTNLSYLKKKVILDFFKSPKEYVNFVLNQVDYQRELDRIKHLILE